ncbi:MAG: hypothetical protein ACLP01_14895 [Solirubrobacteraceae bacterium]
MESSEPQLEQVEKPTVARTAGTTESGVPGPVGLGATVLGLQRSAGNRAVVRWLGSSARRAPSGSIVARAAADPRAVGVQTTAPAQADRMTLADFEDFTERQADWASQTKFMAAATVAEELRVVVEIGQEFNKELLSAAGELKMKDLRIAARIAEGRLHLRSYGLAIKRFGWHPAITVADALAWGDASPKLEAALSTDVVRLTIKQGTEGTNLADLVKHKAVDDFIDFVNTTDPLLSAEDRGGERRRTFDQAMVLRPATVAALSLS